MFTGDIDINSYVRIRIHCIRKIEQFEMFN